MVNPTLRTFFRLTRYAPDRLLVLLGGSESRYHHEEYSARIIATVFQDAIENHPGNANYEIKAIDVADLITGTTSERLRPGLTLRFEG